MNAARYIASVQSATPQGYQRYYNALTTREGSKRAASVCRHMHSTEVAAMECAERLSAEFASKARPKQRSWTMEVTEEVIYHILVTEEDLREYGWPCRDAEEERDSIAETAIELLVTCGDPDDPGEDSPFASVTVNERTARIADD